MNIKRLTLNCWTVVLMVGWVILTLIACALLGNFLLSGEIPKFIKNIFG